MRYLYSDSIRQFWYFPQTIVKWGASSRWSEFGRNDHRQDAPHCTIVVILRRPNFEIVERPLEEPWHQNAVSGKNEKQLKAENSPLVPFWCQGSSKNSHYILCPLHRRPGSSWLNSIWSSQPRSSFLWRAKKYFERKYRTTQNKKAVSGKNGAEYSLEIHFWRKNQPYLFH